MTQTELKKENLSKIIAGYNIISISPFNYLETTNWATASMSFICSFFGDIGKVSLSAMSGDAFKSNQYIFSKSVFFGSKNSFFHLLDPSILLMLFKLRNKNIIYCHSILTGLYWLFGSMFFSMPYIFDNHNVEFDRFISTKRFLLAPFIFILEIILVFFSKVTVVGSRADWMRMTSLYYKTDKICVIPLEMVPKMNYINSEKFFSEKWIPIFPINLLFFGSFNYYPNLQSLEFMEKKIAPFLPTSYQIIICGKDLVIPNKCPDNILYLGYVDYLDEIIFSSDCIMVPVFCGGGVKTKIIHAMAYNKTIITTMEWISGINTSWYSNIFMSDKNNFYKDMMSIMN